MPTQVVDGGLTSPSGSAIFSRQPIFPETS